MALNNAEVLLERAVAENLNQEVAKVPDDRAIKEMHSFSAAADTAVRNMSQARRKRSRLFYIRMAACAAAAFCAIIVLSNMDLGLNFNKLSEPSEQYSMSGGQESADADESAGESNKQLYDDYEKEISQEEQEITADIEKAIPGNSVLTERVILSADTINYEHEQKIELNIENISDHDVAFGTSYRLEVWQDGEWEELPHPDGIMFDLSLTILKPGESRSLIIDLGAYELETDKYQYRIVKRIEDEETAVELLFVTRIEDQ